MPNQQKNSSKISSEDSNTECLNIGDNDYIYACESLFFPLIREFAPDLIIISAGFDSAKGD
jgi:acetoin utilization deacetylase AcuC-like enzyme